MAKPKVTVNPVANQYAAKNERIIEYSHNGLGGLIALRGTDDGKLVVDLYRHDEDVKIRVAPIENPSTWTFVGHWEDDRIVVEYVLDGDHEDRRKDAGYWEQGLFASSASAATQDEALAQVREEYETQYNEED